jgi:hypothetical protein
MASRLELEDATQVQEEQDLSWISVIISSRSRDSNKLDTRKVLRQSVLPEFSCFGKYLALVIQFSVRATRHRHPTQPGLRRHLLQGSFRTHALALTD